MICEENKEDIYHVHRFVLAVGPNASEFFHDEFVGRFGDASNIQPSSRRAQSGGKIKVFGSTILRMNSASANVMPNVLNFLYENRFEPTPQTCLPMLQVSDQLRIRKLHTLLTDYVQRTMNVENAPIYLLYANLYKMEKVILSSDSLSFVFVFVFDFLPSFFYFMTFLNDIGEIHVSSDKNGFT